MTETTCYCVMLRKATRRLTAYYDEALAPVGITVAQFSLLRAIERGEPISLTEIARVMDLDRSTIGRNVRLLQRHKLVTPTGRTDQREAAVRLSDAGRQTLAAAVPLWEAAQADVEARLGPDRTIALLAELDIL